MLRLPELQLSIGELVVLGELPQDVRVDVIHVSSLKTVKHMLLFKTLSCLGFGSLQLSMGFLQRLSCVLHSFRSDV